MSDRSQAERVAMRFHAAYERLAPEFGYKTREASAKPWDEVPEPNRRLMTRVVAELMAGCVISVRPDDEWVPEP